MATQASLIKTDPETGDVIFEYTFPVQFKFTVAVPEKRVASLKTFGGIAVQESCNPFSSGYEIPFNAQLCDLEYKELYNAYIQTGQMTFSGYWGDEYTVIFNRLNPSDVTGRIFDVSGTLLVVCVITPPCPQ